MVVAILELAVAAVGLINFHAGAELKSVVERGAVEYRYIPGRDREAAQSSHKWLHTPARKSAELIAQRAEGAHVGRSRPGNVGCGPAVHLGWRHQDHVEGRALYRIIHRHRRAKFYDSRIRRLLRKCQREAFHRRIGYGHVR